MAMRLFVLFSVSTCGCILCNIEKLWQKQNQHDETDRYHYCNCDEYTGQLISATAFFSGGWHEGVVGRIHQARETIIAVDKAVAQEGSPQGILSNVMFKALITIRMILR